MDTDPSNKRARRFFFDFIEEELSSIRSWESHTNQTSSAGGSKGNQGGKPNKNLPSTLNFNTNVEGMICILTSCGKHHKNKSGKQTKSLIFCSHFINLKLHEKNRLIKSANICTKCLCSGHKQKDCKSTLTCSSCGSGTHHVLVCRSNGKTDKGETPKPKKPKDPNTVVHKTDAEEDPAVDGASEGASEDLPETTNHKLEVFSMTDVEVFLVGKELQVDLQHTCVGSVNVKSKDNTTTQLCMFDNCSQ